MRCLCFENVLELLRCVQLHFVTLRHVTSTLCCYVALRYVATSLILLPQGKKVGAARCEYVFDVHNSKTSKRLKLVLLHLWRINVKTTGGLINIPLPLTIVGF